MKKFLYVAVAALAMTACSNETEIIEATQQEIGFAATNFMPASRNTPALGNTFSTSNKMIVTAVHTDAVKGAKEYFEGVTCAYDNGVWKSGYLWPLEGKMQFGAYSTDATPDNVAWTYTAAKDIETVTLDFTTNLLAGHEDVLYSDITSNVDCKKVSGANAPVDMNFRHALAWICVNLKTTNDGVGKVRVSDVIVNNAYLSGKALVTFGSTSTVAWDNLAGQDDTSIDASFATTTLAADATGNGTAWSNGLLVPTQDKTSLTIVYAVKNGDNWTNDMSYTIDLTATPAEQWVAGQRYNYNITIGLNEITFKGTVTNFDQEDKAIVL